MTPAAQINRVRGSGVKQANVRLVLNRSALKSVLAGEISWSSSSHHAGRSILRLGCSLLLCSASRHHP
jgi:hypothetical protein